MKLKTNTHVEGHGPYSVIISQPVYQDGSYILTGTKVTEVRFHSVMDALTCERHSIEDLPADTSIEVEGPGLDR